MALGNYFAAQYAPLNLAQSQTDTVVVAAQASKVIKVVGLWALAAGTTTQITFNSKSLTLSTAITPVNQIGATGGGFVLPFFPPGWFVTNTGEGLTVTSGSGSTVGIQVVYVVMNP